jgi:hypothetical protein
MIAQIFFELRGIATLRITFTYHFIAFCGAFIALVAVTPAEFQDMGWSKAVSVVTMLAFIIDLLAYIVHHREFNAIKIDSLLY